MMTPEIELIIEEYFSRLERALAQLPEHQRNQLLLDVRQHVAEACDELVLLDEAGVRTILDHLGSPEAIAAEALDEVDADTGTVHLPDAQRPRLSRRAKFVSLGAVVLIAILVSAKFVDLPAPAKSVHIGGYSAVVKPAGVQRIYTVPDVVGLSPPQAISTLAAVGLKVTVVRASAPTTEHALGTVIAQSPAASREVPFGSQIILSVNGPANSANSTATTIVATTTTLP